MIKLVAIDLDGTLFDSHSNVTDENINAIHHLREHDIFPVISTGRPYAGIPDTLKKLPFTHAITANGAGIYEIASGKCLYEEPMNHEVYLPLLRYLETKEVHLDAFVEGNGFSTYRSLEITKKLDIPRELLAYIINSRTRVENLEQYLVEHNKQVQKTTLNFYTDQNGVLVDREDVRQYLEQNPDIDVVCGGYHNLEFTKMGVNKGAGLRHLADELGLNIDETMAIGDTENDLSIILAAGLGVAMGNAIPEIIAVSDCVTATNDESGVAKAIYRFCNFT